MGNTFNHTFVDAAGNERTVAINKDEIARTMKSLNLRGKEGLAEAIDVYLDDHDLLANEERVALDTKAKAVKINHDTGRKTKKGGGRKPDLAKEKLLTQLFEALNISDLEFDNLAIANKNNEITFSIGEIEYSIKLIKHNVKKN